MGSAFPRDTSKSFLLSALSESNLLKTYEMHSSGFKIAGKMALPEPHQYTQYTDVATCRQKKWSDITNLVVWCLEGELLFHLPKDSNPLFFL